MKAKNIIPALSLLFLAAFVGCNPFYSVEQSMVERGYRWVHRGEMDKAIATFEMTIDKYPQSVLAHLGLGDALFEARKDREAADSYTRAISLIEKAKPKSELGTSGETEAVGKRFFSYQNQGLRFPHGLEAYLYLRRGGAFESLAILDSQLNCEYFSKALADYDKAIKLAPKYEEAQRQRNRLIELSKN
jgi:tetratricopeptide (TPR) repeat protein